MRVSREQWAMDMALVTAQRGTCNRLRVGAVAMRDNRVLLTGYNGVPAGQPHCSHTNGEACSRAIHAEQNIIATAARYGIALEGCHLFVTDSPCLACAGLAINAGIVSVIYLREYRDLTGVELLRSAGLECRPLSSS